MVSRKIKTPLTRRGGERRKEKNEKQNIILTAIYNGCYLIILS